MFCTPLSEEPANIFKTLKHVFANAVVITCWIPSCPRLPKGTRELKSHLLHRVNLSPSVGASDFSVPVQSAEWVFTAFDAPHIPPPPSITLKRVQALTDSRPAVTCLITRDVRMPGIVFASPLRWSMRAFQKAKNEISVENCGSFANAPFNIENYKVRQNVANAFLQSFPYCDASFANYGESHH